MDEKELKAFTEELNKKFDSVLSDVKAKADSKEIETKLTEIQEKMAKMVPSEELAKLQKQYDAIDLKVQEYQINFTKQGQQTIPQQLKSYMEGDEYKKAIKARMPHQFEVKANELTTSNSFTETNGPVIQRLYEPGVISAPQRPTPVWDLISKGTINSDYAILTERSSQTIGASATNVAEAGVFGQSYAGWTTYKFAVEKIAEYIKVASEKLEDWEYVRGEVMDMLMTNIPHVREGKFLTGYTAGNWAGLINTTSAVAKSFAKPTGFNAVDDANIFDVLRAAILQVEIGNSASLANKMGYMPNAILVHPADAANMELVKANDGTYVIPPFASASGMTVKGVRVIPDLYITAGEFLVGDFTAAKAWVNRALTVRMFDQNDTDPIHDLVTFTATHRLAFGVGATRAFAFVKGDFASAKALIMA